MAKKPQTAKARAASIKNILSYERWDDMTNFMHGFMFGASLMFVLAWIIYAIAM